MGTRRKEEESQRARRRRRRRRRRRGEKRSRSIEKLGVHFFEGIRVAEYRRGPKIGISIPPSRTEDATATATPRRGEMAEGFVVLFGPPCERKGKEERRVESRESGEQGDWPLTHDSNDTRTYKSRRAPSSARPSPYITMSYGCKPFKHRITRFTYCL